MAQTQRPFWFGFLMNDLSGKTQKTIWFHALSLGEVVGATPTIRLLKKNRPQDRIVVSVTTDSGFEAAKRKLPDVDALFFFPWIVFHLPGLRSEKFSQICLF